MDLNDQGKKTALKNAAASKDTSSQKPAHKKRSVKTIIALVVDSLLVLCAVAVGIFYLKAAYHNAETLLSYKTTIGASVQNDNVQLTLHESVADDYTTAYIFSIKGLTDTGKSILAVNKLDDTCQSAFYQTNAEESAVETLGDANPETKTMPAKTESQLYTLKQLLPSGESADLDIGLQREGVTGDALNSAVYEIFPIGSLSNEDCEYYALYIISEEPQQLILTFGGLQLPLPEATAHTPGAAIGLGGCIQNYFLSEGKSSQTPSGYPVDAVLTPLGLYVNGDNQDSSYFEHAKLALTDGSEIDLNQAVQGEKDYSPSYFSSGDGKLSVYLFKDIKDISTVKSLVLYDDIEFPTDGGTPFARSTGRRLEPSSNTAILRTIAQRLRDYIAKACPITITCQNFSASKTVEQDAWSNIKYGGGDTLCFDVASDKTANKADRFFVSLTNLSGGTLEQEARAKIGRCNSAAGNDQTPPFNIIKTGTFVGTELLAVDCGELPSGCTRRCIFAIYNNQLVTVRFDSYNGSDAYKAFDDLLKLF